MAIDSMYYVHESDKAALKALKAIPGFQQLMRAYMKVWNERQYRITNMSTRIKISEKQLPEYYHMLPPICEKLGIEVPDLYLDLNVNCNAFTSGETKPFIVMNSGLLETIPNDLIPTVLAHECGHIACHHVLYRTMGSMLLNSTNSLLSYIMPHSSLITLPLVVAFYYWMRCSELSADRAAVIYEGSADKVSDMCMRLAGYDKDIVGVADKEEFMKQAEEYRQIVKGSAWDKTLEFFALSYASHPFTAVRALECEEWAKSDQFKSIMEGTYLTQPMTEEEKDAKNEEATENREDANAETAEEKKPWMKLDISKFTSAFAKKEKENETDENQSVPDEIRKYKALMDDGIITEEEFEAKKKQLLNL